MANQKITALTALAVAPAAGDLLAIVDVSDTTDSAQGTTKKIAVSNFALAAGDVVGPSSSVDNEIVLFNGTTGRLVKRASTSGLLKAASGVIAAAVAGTDYVAPTAVMNDQTGTTYTLDASDNGKVVTCSNAGGITVTVPSGLGVGFNCMVIQKGAGQVTFTGSGATVNNRQSHTKIAGQYGVVSLVAYVADTFVLAGDTAA